MKIYFDSKRHIVCTPYTRENLHAMAKILGIKRHWFHATPYPHYDMPKSWIKPMDFGLILDSHLFNVDVYNACEGTSIAYEEVSTRCLVQIVRSQGKVF